MVKVLVAGNLKMGGSDFLLNDLSTKSAISPSFFDGEMTEEFLIKSKGGKEN